MVIRNQNAEQERPFLLGDLTFEYFSTISWTVDFVLLFYRAISRYITTSCRWHKTTIRHLDCCTSSPLLKLSSSHSRHHELLQQNTHIVCSDAGWSCCCNGSSRRPAEEEETESSIKTCSIDSWLHPNMFQVWIQVEWQRKEWRNVHPNMSHFILWLSILWSG